MTGPAWGRTLQEGKNLSEPIRYAVIMAGGSGERFWPLSRALRPKQMLRLTSETETLLQESVSRIAPLIPVERILIATSSELVPAIRGADDRILPENVIGEPCRRNTTGCLVWVAAQLLARHGDDQEVVMAVLTADHLIGEQDVFRDCVRVAMEAAEQSDSLVTMGAMPTRAETGYGYIEVEDSTLDLRKEPIRAHRVAGFREKPNVTLAEEFLASGEFLWNCGMFFWRISVLEQELKLARPEIAEVFRRIVDNLRANNEDAAARAFAELESISIDYALLERSNRVLVVPAAFSWDDVGAWDSLGRTREPDRHENVVVGDAVLLDVHNSIVYNDAGGDDTAVALLGVSDLVVVVAQDAVLVAHKSRVQDVRRAVQELKARKAKQV
jgi:mannose-1-phosphate guanylyltransferase